MESAIKTTLVVGLILAVYHILDMWHQDYHFFKIKHVNSLIFSKSGVENIHTNSRVLDHREGVESRGDIILVKNVVHHHLNVGDPTLHHTVESLMFLHTLVDDFDIFFLSLGFLNLSWSIKGRHVEVNWLVFWSLDICHSANVLGSSWLH